MVENKENVHGKQEAQSCWFHHCCNFSVLIRLIMYPWFHALCYTTHKRLGTSLNFFQSFPILIIRN
ncbi:Uncharacterized protein APZ42_026274 [Daphnia magna]|uniref:Uncharacterized protein n=1 Tax=Daphnia magna TaxID=35525 RepID=A0A0P5VNQ1_9CRUS|nr:Uncharacterized protein APZ42_026274 [Daphnia magna]